MCLGTILILISIKSIICKHNGVQSLSEAVNRFGCSLYQELAKEKGNILFSPFSAHATLCFLTLGAEGYTRQELLSKLMLKDIENLKKVYSIDITRIDPALIIANNMFVSKRLKLLQKFKSNAKEIFHTTPQSSDFTYPAKSVSLINNWVYNHTRKKISNIVDGSFISSNTMLVLLNAVFFKANWELSFNKSSTIQNHAFRTAEKNTTCSMMVMKKKRHRYFVNKRFSLLELDFHKSNIEIAFVVPNSSNQATLEEIEEIIKQQTFFHILAKSRLRPVNIFIPKLKLDKEYSLRDYFTKIGISDIFTSPDFSNLFEGDIAPRVDRIQHKVHVEVDENGATATAATSGAAIARVPVPEFVLDQPFLFFLYDNKTQIILMQGRVVDPTS